MPETTKPDPKAKPDPRLDIVQAVKDAAEELGPEEFQDAGEVVAEEIEEEAEEPEEKATEEPEEAPEEEDEEEPEEQPEDLTPDLIESLTDEDRAAIKANPAMAKLERSLLRAYAQKTMRLAAYNRIIKGLEDNPDETLAQLAAGRGLTVTKPAAAAEVSAVDKARVAAREEVVRLFGAEHADAVLGLIEQVAAIKTEAAVEPLKRAAMSLGQHQQAADIAAATSTFMREHRQEITSEVERGMVSLGQELLSKGMGPGPETNRDAYMEMLLEVTLARQGKSKTTTRLAERTKRNLEEAEPQHGAGSRAAVKSKSKVDDAKDLKTALRIAANEAWAELSGRTT